MSSDLDKLKELLFGHEKKALDALTRRLDTAESRTADVADVLPDAIVQSSEQGPALTRSLQAPLEETLSEAIGRDPHRFAAALYPVMGPAIRRAIAEAMRSLVVSINRAIDTSLSPMARLRAHRSGLSLAEYVLRESLVFRVDEVYLIDPRSGLLIDHVRHPDTEDKDEDAVSAMLTAIQDFVRDSFSKDDERLASASVGQFTVWVSQGPYAMLAAVIRGTPPASLRDQLDLTVERLHVSHATALKSFAGETLEQVEPELSTCLRYQLRDEAAAPRLFSWPLAVALVALLGLAGYAIYSQHARSRTLAAWRDALAATPGIVVTAADVEARGWRRTPHYRASGLRDPLAAEPLDIARQSGIAPEQAQAAFEPYASLEAPIVLARAQAALTPPDGVTLSLDGHTLVAAGEASAQWRERFVLLAPALTGVGAVDTSALVAGDAVLFSEVMRATEPPEQVRVRVEDGVAIFAGQAPARWLARLPEALAAVDGLRGTDLRALSDQRVAGFERQREALEGARVAFQTGLLLTPAQASALPALAQDMRALLALGRELDRDVSFMLTGLTDVSGSEATNRPLRAARAQQVRRQLIELGVPASALAARGGLPAQGAAGSDNLSRAVRIAVRVVERPD